VVAVVVGALDEVVPHPSPPNLGTLPPNLWTLPRSVLADRGQRTTALVVPLHQIADDPPWMRPALAVQLYRDELPQDWSDHGVAGVGEPKSDLVELRSSWSQARLAAMVASAVPTVRPVARWADLRLYRLLAAQPRASLILDPDAAG
jgi:hypothetical protein